MSDDAEIEEVEEDWDEVLIEMRKFAVEQAVLMRGPHDKLGDILERADSILDYMANGRG